MNETFPIICANLKAHKTWDQMSDWLKTVGQASRQFKGTLIVCPSYPYLAAIHQQITKENYQIKLGSQDLSQFEQGAYTGEVAASQIADICSFAIIGHSERRQNFKETANVLSQKVANAQKALIQPIFCIQSSNDPIPQGVQFVAYEPVFAIGTGNPDTPDNVHQVAQTTKTHGQLTVLYGGSVSPENIKSYLAKGLVDGVLVGATNSLDPQKFIAILNSAQS